MPDLDSYILIEKEEDVEKMIPVCIECKDIHYPDSGWFYRGSEEGYSDYLWKCYKCEKVIHDPNEEETQTAS